MAEPNWQSAPPAGRRLVHTSGPVFAQTYYEVLGVSRGASDSDIKKSYYKLAKKYHPDTNQGDPAAAKKFQEVQRAYDTLRDTQKRAAYDQLGHQSYEAAESGGGAPGGGAGPFGAGQGVQVDPEDLFREFFGGGGAAAGGFQGTIFEHIFGGAGGPGGAGFGGRTRRGRSLQAALTINFEDAVKGTRRMIDPSSLGVRGLGSSPIEINIPAGVDNGFQIRLEGQGLPGPQGTPPGDLLVQILVAPSPRFHRDGFDLYTEARVGIADAALGTTVDISTIDGKAEVKVKPGTQPGDKLRMRGYGVPMDLVGQRGRRGDQYVVVQVTVPRQLSERQKELLEEFRGGPKATSSPSSSHSPPGNAASSAAASAGEKAEGETAGKAAGEKEGAESGRGGTGDGGSTNKKKRGWFF